MNNSLNLQQLLFIDIETVPMAASFQALSTTWQELWFEKISKTMPENSSVEEIFIQRAGVMAEFAKIVCISTGYLQQEQNQWKLRIKSFAGDDEKKLLETFITTCNKIQQQWPLFQFCGHNIKEFDIPFLCRRMLVHGLPLPSYLYLHNAKPWEVKAVDTLHWWRFGDYKNYTSLHLLASVLGIPTSKDDITGSEVQHVYYKEQNLQRIVTYCQKDVAVVANIMLRFQEQPLLASENIHIAS
ncbi:MAG TPA: 3'-5' exonuclease [Chitinophagaceae bacterium]|nr:3'-5' exonuclease [Chitinophagaceae bacterium]